MSQVASNTRRHLPEAALVLAAAALFWLAPMAPGPLAQPSPPEAVEETADSPSEAAPSPAEPQANASEDNENNAAPHGTPATEPVADGGDAEIKDRDAESDAATVQPEEPTDQAAETPTPDAAPGSSAADTAEAGEEKAPSAADDPAKAAAKPTDDGPKTDSAELEKDASTADGSPADKSEQAQPESTANSEENSAEAEVAAEPEPASVEANKLKVATWSGAYGQAQREAVIERFKAERSIDIEVVERMGEDRIDLINGTHGRPLDAAEFSGAEIEAECEAGQLVKLAEAGGTAHSGDAARDFLPGSLKPCGVGAFAWSHVIAFNPKLIGKQIPRSLADVFDAEGFPGKRAFFKEPRFLLEAALMADGVEPGDVYQLLSGEEGLERAFGKLEALRDNIVWVDDGKAAMKLLEDGKAVMAQTFSGRAFFAAARGAPIDLIWDGQIYSMTYWAIPAQSPRQDLARDFLAFATEPQQLAAVAKRFPYGPTRSSALAITKRHLVAGLELDRYLPTAPENMKTALALDEAWWTKNREPVEAKFTAWLSAPNSEEPENSDEKQ